MGKGNKSDTENAYEGKALAERNTLKNTSDMPFQFSRKKREECAKHIIACSADQYVDCFISEVRSAERLWNKHSFHEDKKRPQCIHITAGDQTILVWKKKGEA